MLPVLEALLAGVAVGIINRFLARLEAQCPEERVQRDDSDTSTASSGTVEIPHF